MKMKSKETYKIVFINTYEIVIPLWKYILRYFNHTDIIIHPLITNLNYRGDFQKKKNYYYIKVPSVFRNSKILINIYYSIGTLFFFLSKKYSLTVFFTQPPGLYIIGSYLMKVFNIPYFVYIMDLYPDIITKSIGGSTKNYVHKFFSKLSVSALKNSHAIIVIGRDMHKKIEDLGVPSSKIHYIPNITSQEIEPVFPENNLFLQDNPALSGKFIILYAGNMGRAHEFQTILKVASSLQNNKDIIFLFVGKGFRRKEIESYSSSINIKIMNSVEWGYFKYLLSAASIHFISLKNEFTGLLVPSKLYSCLASAKPIVYEGDGEIAYTINEAQAGKVISMGNQKHLCETILHYYYNPDLVISDGQNGYEFYHKNFSLEKFQNYYFPKFEKLIYEAIQ